MTVKFIQQCDCRDVYLERYTYQPISVVTVEFDESGSNISEFQHSENRTTYRCSVCGIHCYPFVID